MLNEYGRIIVFSETAQWETIKKYQLEIDSSDLHDILFFAKLYVGEGATMAAESAILGTPSIYVSNTKRGYLNDLEVKYILVYTILDKCLAFEKAIALLQMNTLNEKWMEKRNLMLREKIEIVDFIVNSIESHG